MHLDQHVSRVRHSTCSTSVHERCLDNVTQAIGILHVCCSCTQAQVLSCMSVCLSSGIKHDGVVCDGCSSAPLYGIRWKCSDCPDVNLCSPCYHGDRHNLRHRFVRIAMPNSQRCTHRTAVYCLIFNNCVYLGRVLGLLTCSYEHVLICLATSNYHHSSSTEYLHTLCS